MGVARGILRDGDETRHTAPFLVFRAHRMAGAFRGHHQHIDVGTGVDQVEMDIEAVGEQQRRAVLHVGREVGLVDIGLQLVGRQHHHDIGPFGGFRHGHDLEAFAFGLLGRRGAFAQRHDDVLDPGVAHVEDVGMPLAAVSDDRDFLALDQIKIGIPIVVDAHGPGFPERFVALTRPSKRGWDAGQPASNCINLMAAVQLP